MKKQYVTTLMLGLLPLFFSCSHDDSLSDGRETDTGEIALSLKAQTGYKDITVAGASKAAENDLQLDVEDFKVQILNSKGTVSKQWDRYAEMPAKVRLNAATYTMRASCGSPTAAGFDAWYFLGEESFTLGGQQSRELELTCKLANSKVAVVYGGQVRQDYSDFRVEVSSQGSSAVTFAKDETRAAYLPSGLLQIKIYLTNENGTRTYVPDPVSADPQTFVTLNIDSKDASGTLSLTITTETATEEKEVSVDLPAFMLPKAAPTMNVDGFDAGTGILSTTEGVKPVAAQINLRADGQISHCKVRVNSEELAAQGWPAEFDLADGSLTDQTKELLRAGGLRWTESIRDNTLAGIDFTELAERLTASGETARSSSFTVQVTDAFGQNSPEKTVTLTATPPAFTLGAIGAGDVWATKADLAVEVAAGNPEIPVVEYKTASSDWTACTVADRSVGGNRVALCAKSLPAGSAVSFRVKYNGHYSAEQTVTTESATQVPNSDFETYCEYKYNSGNDINQYYWYASQNASDKWWATRNPASASQLTGSWMGGKSNYTRNNGTTPVDNGASGKAVEMKTTGWGRGNTSTVNGGGTKYNITASVLFIGDYAYTLEEEGGSTLPGKGIMSSETITQGHAFASRPARFQFQYKYAPLKSESFEAYAVVQNRDNGTVELGRAQVPASVASQQVDNMTDLSVDFVYDPQYSHLKATHICIFFASCNKMEWKEGTDRPATTNSGTGTLHYGSILTVDNLNLDYNF